MGGEGEEGHSPLARLLNADISTSKEILLINEIPNRYTIYDPSSVIFDYWPIQVLGMYIMIRWQLGRMPSTPDLS